MQTVESDSVLSTEFITDTFGEYNIFDLRFYITNETMHDHAKSGTGYVINVFQPTITLYNDEHDKSEVMAPKESNHSDHDDHDHENASNNHKSSNKKSSNKTRARKKKTKKKKTKNVSENNSHNKNSNTKNEDEQTQRRLQSSDKPMMFKPFSYYSYILNGENFMLQNNPEKNGKGSIFEVLIVDDDNDCEPKDSTDNEIDDCDELNIFANREKFKWAKSIRNRKEDDEDSFCTGKDQTPELSKTFGCDTMHGAISHTNTLFETEKAYSPWDRCSHILVCPGGILPLKRHKESITCELICVRQFDPMETGKTMMEKRWHTYARLKSQLLYYFVFYQTQ